LRRAPAVKRKTAVTAAFVVGLIFSAVVLVQAFSVAKANWLGPLPPPTPEISIQTPVNGGKYYQEQISLTFTVKAPLFCQIKSIAYRLDNQANLEVQPNATSGGEYSLMVKVSSDGWHVLHVAASGDNGASTDQAITSVTFFVDAAPPSITVLSPQNKSYTASDVLLNFTISNHPYELVSWVGYSLDGQSNVTVKVDIGRIGEFEHGFYEALTLAGLYYGSHDLTLYANDSVGRIGSSEIIYFSIAQETEPEPTLTPQPEQEPFPTTWILVAAASVAFAGAGLLVYFKKRNH
jgi:hypothetical protein